MLLRRYFRRLQRRYASRGSASEHEATDDAQALTNGAAEAHDSGAADAAGKLRAVDVPITCINLLRCNMQVCPSCRFTGGVALCQLRGAAVHDRVLR